MDCSAISVENRRRSCRALLAGGKALMLKHCPQTARFLTRLSVRFVPDSGLGEQACWAVSGWTSEMTLRLQTKRS